MFYICRKHPSLGQKIICNDLTLTWKQAQSHPPNATRSPPLCLSNPSKSGLFQPFAPPAMPEGEQMRTWSHFRLVAQPGSTSHKQIYTSPLPPCRWWSVTTQILIHKLPLHHQNWAGLWRKSSICFYSSPTQQGTLQHKQTMNSSRWCSLTIFTII